MVFNPSQAGTLLHYSRYCDILDKSDGYDSINIIELTRRVTSSILISPWATINMYPINNSTSICYRNNEMSNVVCW